MRAALKLPFCLRVSSMQSAWFLFLVILALCPSGQASTRTAPDEFLLTVTVPASEKPVEVSTKILLGKAFEASEMRAGRKITIKGTLTGLKQNRYHLRLTIVDWVSEKVNSTSSFEPDLALGEPWRVGVVSSFIYHYTVLLTRVRDR